ncbi:DUF427 domain-containing protein [Gordonia sp. PKS22-38]|uniref:DUF427 domain-containing protein n=1 Tax=Gordonia prachuapensis TaxID=3115651 RepID=A0ABU7MY18_9ACTN|nr:DUF427 domain-containing protein [Gordonia sp. PKS22-38]
MTRQRLQPGHDHPITVSPDDGRVVVRVGEVVVADTTSAKILREAAYPPVHYIPLDDVDRTLLRDSATTTYCPYKGEANYYDLVVGEEVAADAIWVYREPYDAVAPIAGHVAFYPDRVRVTTDAAVT